jgi:hypothetical protein
MALDRATILQRNNNDLMRPYRQKLDTPLLNQESEVRLKVKERVEAFGLKEDAILANRTLSNEGKQTALAKLVNDSLESLAFVGRVVSDLESDARGRRATLFTVKPPPSWGSDASLQYQRGKETRDQLRGLSQPERDSRFVQAAEADHEATLWSVLDAPDAQPMVTEEIKVRALEERAKRREPQAFRRLQQLEVLREELAGLRDHVVLWLRQLGGDQRKIFDALGGPEPEPTTAQTTQRMVAA